MEKRMIRCEKINAYLEYESMLLAENEINNRLKMKKLMNEKIKVLFICWRPEVWNSLKSVYESFKKDELFDVIILTIPNKKQLPDKAFSHEEYESEGAEDFWQGFDVIRGFNYETGEWIDPKTLRPDYVFLQQPYNITRQFYYKSWIISKYAKICYVGYAFYMGNGEIFESSHPIDFMKSTSFFFSFDKRHTNDIRNYFKNNNNYYTKIEMTGFPRFDLIKSECSDAGNYTALWTPRWSTSENNCFFFEYKNKLLEYCDSNKDFSLIFRPHPQAFREWNFTGEMSMKEEKKYREEYLKRPNACIDENKDYLITFERVDCFITDFTSLIAEYLVTGKPIVYCHRVDCFTDVGKEIADVCYWVHNYEELFNAITMLKKGEDPLKNKRLSIIQKIVYRPKEGAGNTIKRIIKEDALK